MEIIHEREKCIGCGSCTALCPKYWQIAGDGKAKLTGSTKDPKTGNDVLEIEESGCNQEAADACPVQIIRIVKS